MSGSRFYGSLNHHLGLQNTHPATSILQHTVDGQNGMDCSCGHGRFPMTKTMAKRQYLHGKKSWTHACVEYCGAADMSSSHRIILHPDRMCLALSLLLHMRASMRRTRIGGVTIGLIRRATGILTRSPTTEGRRSQIVK